MNNIKIGREFHHTSIIDDKASIGEGVKVGPFSIINKEVTIENNCEIMSHVVIDSGTTLGSNSVIFPHAIIGCSPQNNKHQGDKTYLIIGNNCTIREGVTLHRGSDNSRGKTVIGDNCMFLAYSHVAHDCVVGNNVTLANNVMLGGHVELGNNVNVGGGGAIHQFVRVGNFAFVGGLAALVNDLIPYGVAIGVQAKFAGLNIIGMKRSNMPHKDIHIVRSAVRTLFDNSKSFKETAIDIKVNCPSIREVPT